jgi:hypothetical protein
VTDFRLCSRPGCGHPAVATLRYNYSARVATVGPLDATDDPHSWDLCSRHLGRLSVPEGWTLDRVADEFSEDFSDEEMQILAEALAADELAAQDEVPAAGAHRSTGPDMTVPSTKVTRTADLEQPSGRHPSRRNLPRHTPPRHLHAVRDLRD